VIVKTEDIKRKYTRAYRRRFKGDNAGYTVVLVVLNQCFTIASHLTRSEADWHRNMLTAALCRLIKTETET
jgi:hypothetical protein